MFAASKSGSFEASDAQFNYVTMLLHGDGTNGAQNNTFVDSSTNNFTITRNGNTTQGTFTPYGANWSNYFDGTGDYLTIADNAALELSTSSFTMEWWSYPTTFASSQFQLSKCATSASTEGFLTYINTSGVLKFNANSVSAWDIANDQGTLALNLNAWNHCAISRNGSSWRMWVNGVSSVTITSALGVQNTTTAYSIGGAANGSAPFLGYMSNTRIVIGSYVYDPASSTLTIPTAPLTAITNTQLLTCQSNRFLDTSSNAFTITKNGDVSVQRFSPFSPTTAYSTSVIGGSLYGDGTGDYLSIPYSSSNSLNAGDFTVEAWVYKNSNAAYMAVGGTMTSAAPYNTKWQIIGDSGGTKITWSTDAFLITSSATLYTGSWYHVAFVRSSGTLRLYINGVLDGSSADTRNYNSATDLWVAQVPENVSGRNWNGYITNFRINPTTAVYTAAFTPPTAPLTATTGTSFLLATTNAGILDNAMMNDLETVGNAQISTSVKKYGTGSMYFDGSGDSLSQPSNPAYIFSTGNLTIEAWIYFNSVANGTWVTTNVTSGFYWQYFSSAISFGRAGGGTDISKSWVPLANAWYHVATVRSGSTVTHYVNGISIGSGTFTDSISATTTLQIGTGGAGSFNGYIDDLRITKGYARYTATFTPPIASFADKG